MRNIRSYEKSYFFGGKNIILVPIFWSYSQFSSYILVAINLIIVIFNLK